MNETGVPMSRRLRLAGRDDLGAVGIIVFLLIGAVLLGAGQVHHGLLHPGAHPGRKLARRYLPGRRGHQDHRLTRS
jgi:hypothetical protein